MALVLALRAPSTEESAALVAGVWRRDDIVVPRRARKATQIPLVHRVVRVCCAPVHADDIARLALAVGDLAGLAVLGHFKPAADPATAADAGGPAEASACVL